MKRTTLAALITTGALTALAAPAAAYATTAKTTGCGGAGVDDRIVKTDTGHGTPAAWADLNLKRYTGIECTAPGHYEVLLVDKGTLRTIPGAGTPNGSGGQIANRVPGRVYGVYALTVTGELAVPTQRDTTLSSTEYVRQLFAQGATVTGGEYAWTYTTVCGEKWVDWSKNNDGQDPSAGNITGKRCPRKPKPTPTPTSPTPTPTPSPTATSPTPSPTSSTPAGEAPAPTPVRTNLPVTG